MNFNFPISWQQLPLEETLEALIDYRGKTPKKTNSGIPLVTAKVVKSGQILPMDEFIAAEDYESWMVRGIPEAGDIVITTEAPLGEVAQIKDANVALAQRIVTLRGKQGILDNNYLLFLMQSSFIQNQLEARASGSTVKGIKQSELRKIILPLPPIEEQKRIAGILKSLDDKIHLNNQINQTLESIAQAIFKSWFIDFEPVKAKIKAKLEGKDAVLAAMCAISGKNEAELKQMTVDDFAELQATAALFPDELVGSELGEVPKGWGINNLGDIGKFNPGSAFNPEYQGQKVGEIPFIKVSDMNLEGNEVFITKANNYIHDDLQKKLKMKTHSQGSTVFAKIGVALISNRRRILIKPTLIDNNMMSIAAIDDYATPYYLYLLLRTIDFNILVSGTALPYLNVSDLRKILVILPPKNCLDIFEAKVSPCFQQLNSNSIQNQTLSSLRNGLLPELLLGNLVVSDSGE